MSTVSETETFGTEQPVDPRALLAKWANANDEWVRLIVAEVIATGRPVGAPTIEQAYRLFRQEKALDKRELPLVPMLDIEARQDESAPPLTLVRLSNVQGVNALVSGASIEPHEGLTILYGENGTGKTGYSRIFKTLANSRTADTILGNIEADTSEEQSAKLEFKLGSELQTLDWTGERGKSPFTRMSIFDSPAVRTHVDEDLDYVYTPASLALFNDVTTAIQAVGSQIDAAISSLGSGSSGLRSRFQRGSTIHPLIETLGASTDLVDLKSRTAGGDAVDQEIDSLAQTVASLRANSMGTQMTARKSQQRVLAQAVTAADFLLDFDQESYNQALVRRSELRTDYDAFRSQLFAAADLPTDPDETWHTFIAAGETYRKHLDVMEVHDENRCLYCRQPVLNPALDLLRRYSTYLEGEISASIRSTDTALAKFQTQVAKIKSNELVECIAEYGDVQESDRPSFLPKIVVIEDLLRTVTNAVVAERPVDTQATKVLPEPKADVDAALKSVAAAITDLESQMSDRKRLLREKEDELLELKDAFELGKSWPAIEAHVSNAKEADRLRILRGSLSALGRTVTELAKTASDRLINQSFGTLFLEECEALRAREMKLQFVGREGKAQRRKVMSGKHKPSKVLSEGEQKVLALADFLAEARLAGITAPVIFDDPVSSLDHRRINEVAQRIAELAENNQVIVFTHDILFATTLLALFEKSKRCAYFHVSDEKGKGGVTRATGPRIDSLSAIKGRVNSAIQTARSQEGEARDALVHTGYSHLRSWCEVFVEDEVLRGVTRRYRANVQMSTLTDINVDELSHILPKVTELFDTACRYIDGHSQPLITLGVSPTLTGLEEHWAELQELKKINEGKQAST